MKLHRLTGLALLGLGLLVGGCQDASRDTERGTAELQVLHDRFLVLTDALQDAGTVTGSDLLKLQRLEAEIAAWNARYDLPDVVIAGGDGSVLDAGVIVGAEAPGDPIAKPNTDSDCTWSCPEVTTDLSMGIRRICVLEKEICYTNGSVDCEYRCYLWPIFIL